MKTSLSRMWVWMLCILAVVCATGSAFAQAGGGIVLTTNVYQDVQVKGPDGTVTTKRLPAKTVVPGGEVIYEIGYENTGKAVATDVAINNPLQPELVFVAVEGTPATAVSVDGGKTFGNLPDLKVTGNDGKTRPAQADDVTNVRWILARVEAGAKGKVSFRVRVR